MKKVALRRLLNMQKKISSPQFFGLFLFCFIASSMDISLYLMIKMVSFDSYISVFIGNIIGIVPLVIFIYIFNNFTDKDISNKNIFVFGKIFGRIINYVLAILFFIIGATFLFDLSNFTISQYLDDTNIIYIFILLGIIIYHINNKGIEVIGRVSAIFIFIFFLLFIIGEVPLIKIVSINNLKPFLEYGIKKPMLAGIINSIITIIPTYTLLIVPKDNITDKGKAIKYLIVSYIISSFIIFIISFTANSILGSYLINLYQYPGYIILKKVTYFNFIERIENFLSFYFIISLFITISMIFYYIKSIIKKGKNSKVLNMFLIVTMIVFSFYFFKNTTIFNNYIFYIYPYILSLILIIHIIILIGIIVKKKST